METFQLKPCQQVGLIKQAIREAILDGQIRNEYEEAYAFMLETAQKYDLHPINAS
jgi:hypothetical protein